MHLASAMKGNSLDLLEGPGSLETGVRGSWLGKATPELRSEWGGGVSRKREGEQCVWQRGEHVCSAGGEELWRGRKHEAQSPYRQAVTKPRAFSEQWSPLQAVGGQAMCVRTKNTTVAPVWWIERSWPRQEGKREKTKEAASTSREEKMASKVG